MLIQEYILESLPYLNGIFILLLNLLNLTLESICVTEAT